MARGNQRDKARVSHPGHPDPLDLDAHTRDTGKKPKRSKCAEEEEYR